MGSYASTGAAYIPAVARQMPTQVLHGELYNQQFYPMIQLPVDMASIGRSGGNVWFVIAMADPSALDVNFVGLRMWMDYLKSFSTIDLARVVFLCADAHVDQPTAFLHRKSCVW